MDRQSLATASGREVESTAGIVTRHSAVYNVRVRDVVHDWCRLLDTPPSAVDLLSCLVDAAEYRPRLLHERAPRLCADGSPIEVCERLGPRPLGPAITCESAASDRPSDQRLHVALHHATDLVAGIPGAALSVRAIADILMRGVSPRANPAIWIGAECDEIGRSHFKVYFSIDGRVVHDIASRCERGLELVLRDGASRARSSIELLQARGYLRMLALSFGAQGFSGAKLYARFRRVDLDTLRALCEAGDAPVEPFDSYVRRVLRQRRTWFDARAGVGVALDASGSAGGAAIYHYPHGYFASDEQLRIRLLEVAAEFGWDPTGYRPASRLIDAPDGSRVRSLLAFGVSSKHGTGFHAYGRTGHFAA